MTQEEKDLLLQDLCARLPYGVKCVSGVDDATLIIEGINPNCCGASEVQVTYERSGINFDTTISAIKPYLFPLSSMTEEQESHLYFNTKFKIDMFGDLVVRVTEDDNYCYTDIIDYTSLINWLNKNHFDYRGLIEKGLAIDATGLNIY